MGAFQGSSSQKTLRALTLTFLLTLSFLHRLIIMKLAVCALLACFVLLAEARSHHNPNVNKFLRAVRARHAMKDYEGPLPAPPPVINAAAQICGLQTTQFVIDAIMNGSEDEIAAYQATALGIAETLTTYLETFEAADLPDDMEDAVCPELPDMTELAELRAAVLNAIAENTELDFTNLIKINIAKQIVGASVLVNSVGDIDCAAVEAPAFLAGEERGLQDLADNIDCPTDFMICAAANAQDIEPEQFRQYLCVQALLKLASTIPNIVDQLTDNVLPQNPIQLAIASNVLSADEKRMRMADMMTRDIGPQQLIAGSICSAQTGMFVIRNILEADDDTIAAYQETAQGIASQLATFFETLSNADIPEDVEASFCPELADMTQLDELRQHVLQAVAENAEGAEVIQALIKVKIAHQVVGAAVLINEAPEDCDAVTDPTEGDGCPTDGMLCLAANANEIDPDQFRQFLCVQAFFEMVTSIAGNAIEQLPANPIQLALIASQAAEEEESVVEEEARQMGPEAGPGGAGALCEAQTTQFVMNIIQEASAAAEEGDTTVLDVIKTLATSISSEVASYMEDWDPEALPEGMETSVCPDTLDLPEFSEVVPAILTALTDMGADEDRLAAIFKRRIANNIIGAAVLSHVADTIECPEVIVEERLAKIMPAMIRPGPIDAPMCPEPAVICLARHALENNPEGLKNFLCANALIEIAQSLPLPILMQIPANPFAPAE